LGDVKIRSRIALRSYDLTAGVGNFKDAKRLASTSCIAQLSFPSAPADSKTTDGAWERKGAAADAPKYKRGPPD
jgi:hypothetical protein